METRSPPDSCIDPRKLLLSVFQHALEVVNGRRVVHRALQEEIPAQDGTQRWQVIAIGKAAASMTLGALDTLEDRIAAALVISRDGHFDPALGNDPRVECLAAGHPVPDERSLAAGRALLETIDSCAPGTRLLFLVSGGASSLVEVLRPGVSLEQLREWNRWAQASALDIAEINAVRARLSSIKGGQLLDRIGDREALVLFISDVPGDDPSLIGSGLVGEARAAADDPLPPGLPGWVQKLVSHAPGVKVTGGAHVHRRVVATLDKAMEAARAKAEAMGLRVRLQPGRFAGPATVIATRICHELMLGTAQVHVWGGESTVTLPESPGRGGRNQHLALAAARLLVSHSGMTVLAAGTDGTDGSTDDAGALVDEGTLERGTLDGLDADDCLLRADSATFLQAAGDLVHTGPTGTNVGDLVLACRPG